MAGSDDVRGEGDVTPAPPLLGSEAEPEVRGFFEETRVTFSRLSEALIREYVDSGEPM